MVALRICVLVRASAEIFPDKSVFIKTVSVTSSNLQSMFLKCSGGYDFHHCIWGSRYRNEKSI